MRLEDIDYEFLIFEYRHLGYSEKQIDEKLKMFDSNVSLKTLSLTIPYIE